MATTKKKKRGSSSTSSLSTPSKKAPKLNISILEEGDGTPTYAVTDAEKEAWAVAKAKALASTEAHHAACPPSNSARSSDRLAELSDAVGFDAEEFRREGATVLSKFRLSQERLAQLLAAAKGKGVMDNQGTDSQGRQRVFKFHRGVANKNLAILFDLLPVAGGEYKKNGTKKYRPFTKGARDFSPVADFLKE